MLVWKIEGDDRSIGESEADKSAVGSSFFVPRAIKLAGKTGMWGRATCVTISAWRMGRRLSLK